MLVLQAGDSLGGIAGTATAVTVTATGVSVATATGVETFGKLYQGQLPSSAGALFTVAAGLAYTIKTLIIANPSGSTVTGIKLFVNGTAAANAILGPLSLGAGYTATLSDNGWSVTDANGNLLTSLAGITQLTGDVTAGPGTGSVGASVVKVNGAAVPASAKALGSNSSSQLTAVTVAGSGAGLTTGPTSATAGEIAIYTGTSGQIADAVGAAVVSASSGTTACTYLQANANAGLPTLVGNVVNVQGGVLFNTYYNGTAWIYAGSSTTAAVRFNALNGGISFHTTVSGTIGGTNSTMDTTGPKMVLSLAGGLSLGNSVASTDAGAGNLLVSGSITGASKSFNIPHPKKKGKRLIHGCIEGPELAVYYRGTARLKDGAAEIELPEYFEALTRKQGRTVQLTCVDQIGGLCASSVKNGKFTVRGERPRQKFHWQVTAVRKDQKRLQVERDQRQPSASRTKSVAAGTR